MEPTAEEIESISNALIVINDSDYNEDQIYQINAFLKSYATDYPKGPLERLFADNPDLLDAINNIYKFVGKYQSDTELIDELKIEMDEVFYNINESPGSISI